MAIARRLRYTAAAAALAIYDVTVGAENDTPLSSPLSEPSRLHFHTGLAYPATIAAFTGTINLGAVAANGFAEVTTVIAAHGRPGTPYVEGKLVVGGNVVPFAGSVLVVQGTGLGDSFGRFLSLGANGSNILIHEFSVAHSGAGFAAASFAYTIYLTDMIVG